MPIVRSPSYYRFSVKCEWLLYIKSSKSLPRFWIHTSANPGEGVVKKRQSPDLRSPEVGISVTITLFGIYLVNKTIKYDEWRWICLTTVDFYISDAWKSIFRGKNENIQKVYSIGLWICLSWDFCASSWDHEIVLKTLRLERSALGWRGGGLSNTLTNLCMALSCHENSAQKYKNKEQKIQREIKQSHA